MEVASLESSLLRSHVPLTCVPLSESCFSICSSQNPVPQTSVSFSPIHTGSPWHGSDPTPKRTGPDDSVSVLLRARILRWYFLVGFSRELLASAPLEATMLGAQVEVPRMTLPRLQKRCRVLQLKVDETFRQTEIIRTELRSFIMALLP